MPRPRIYREVLPPALKGDHGPSCTGSVRVGLLRVDPMRHPPPMISNPAGIRSTGTGEPACSYHGRPRCRRPHRVRRRAPRHSRTRTDPAHSNIACENSVSARLIDFENVWQYTT